MLAINEILYDYGKENSQFIELVNTSTRAIQLAGIILTIDTRSWPVADTLYQLPAGAYYVIYGDSITLSRYPDLKTHTDKTCLGSKNIGIASTGSSLVLHDITGTKLDSVTYNPAWHSINSAKAEDRSLERVNPGAQSNAPSNWTTCAAPAGATPGLRNSVALAAAGAEFSVTADPNPFSPDADGFEDITLIRYNTPFRSAFITISIYDDRGRMMRRLAAGELREGSGVIPFNGLDDANTPLRMGMYIVLFEAADAAGSAALKRKFVLVSARKL